jgi:hypothetical protein
MPSSWQVRAAALLVALDAAFGVALLVLAFHVLEGDPGFLFAILPFVSLALGCAGIFLTTAAVALAARLLACARGVRVQTACLGLFLAVSGLSVATMSPWIGLPLAVQGGALVWLMTTPAAKADLDGWREGFTQPAPWGSTPGTGIWSDTPVQQGPWSPDPTTLPWMSWKKHSGPRAPWWQTWEAGLKQGIPLWEAVLLGAALLGMGVGLVLVFLGMGHHRIGGLASAVILGSMILVWFLERRMRTRLAGRQ